MIVGEGQPYSIRICECPVPYIGARMALTADRCEVCGMMTPMQWEALRGFVMKDVYDTMRKALSDGLTKGITEAIRKREEGT